MCSKLKINTAWYSSSIFIVDFEHSRHMNIVFMLLTLNKYLSVECQIQVTMFWKHKKRYICFVIKVARPISFSDLSLHRIETNYEQMTMLWTYYEHNINICFSSEFALGIPSLLSLFRPVFLICSIIAISQRFNPFLLYQTEKLFKLLKQWNKLVGI